LFIDHVSRLKRDLIVRKYNKTIRHKAHEKKRGAAKVHTAESSHA
jgi:hypothetical protein